MSPLELVKLAGLMQLTRGTPEIVIGLLDGPVATEHPDLAGADIREAPGGVRSSCAQTQSAACVHGTFVAGILCARRESAAPAICPGCTLMVRPIFVETTPASGELPSAAPAELAAAIIACIGAGARVINLSAALVGPSSGGEHTLEEALDEAARRGVIVVAAAGNQGMIGSSAITRHPWVIPVVAYDSGGSPMDRSNLGSSIGRRGVGAPGAGVTSLVPAGGSVASGGTSVAAPFVTGAIALLWSEFRGATAVEVKYAVSQAAAPRRSTVVPPLLDAWGAYQLMLGGTR